MRRKHASTCTKPGLTQRTDWLINARNLIWFFSPAVSLCPDNCGFCFGRVCDFPASFVCVLFELWSEYVRPRTRLRNWRLGNTELNNDGTPSIMEALTKLWRHRRRYVDITVGLALGPKSPKPTIFSQIGWMFQLLSKKKNYEAEEHPYSFDYLLSYPLTFTR